MKVHIFFHRTDMDGNCSGAIARMHYERSGLTVVMHPIDYVDFPNFTGFEACDTVVIVDFSFKPDVMAALKAKHRGPHGGSLLIWIDHHKTAIEAIPDTDIFGARQEGVAACVLCWEYFYSTEAPLPRAVALLGAYDVWDKSDLTKWEEEILPFQSGMYLDDWKPNGPNYESWKWLLDPTTGPDIVATTLKNGKVVQKYLTNSNEKAAKAGCYEVTIDGRRGIAMNRGGVNSLFFASVLDPTKHEFMVSYVWTGKMWRVTLYQATPEIDVSTIAKAHGGGGHKGAAGFEYKGNIHEVIKAV